MQEVALIWLVLGLSNSALALGILAFVRICPVLIVSLFAGVVIDHMDRRRLLVITQSTFTISAALLAVLTLTRLVRLHYALSLAFVDGIATAFDFPGRQSFLIDLVGGADDLPNAIALNSAMMNVARACGPAIGGLLIPVVGLGGCFAINAVTYLGVIFSLLAMKLPARVKITQPDPIMLQLKAGLRYVRTHEFALLLLLLLAVTNGISAQYVVLVPVFARKILRVGSEGYGCLLAAQGAGAIVGALIVARRASDSHTLGQNLSCALLVLGCSIITFGTSTVMSRSIVAQVLNGAAMQVYFSSTNTCFQLLVPDSLRGRLMSIYTLAGAGLVPVGSIIIGFAGEYISLRIAVLLCGLCSVVSGLTVLSARSRRERMQKLIEPIM